MSKGSFGISFLVEGEEIDGPKMVRRDVEKAPDGQFHYFRISPMITQLNVKGVYPIPADDGSWGAALLINDDGWKSVQATVAQDIGKLIRVMVNGRPVEFQRVSPPPSDDKVLIIWHGLTEAEIKQMKSKFKELPAMPGARSR